MPKLNQPFTVGLWTVKPGNQKAFVSAWTEFARWTAEHQRGAGTGYLLQDPGNPNEFISFGPWENSEAINAWRERAEFKAFAAKAKELCSRFEPRTLLLAASTE